MSRKSVKGGLGRGSAVGVSRCEPDLARTPLGEVAPQPRYVRVTEVGKSVTVGFLVLQLLVRKKSDA